MSETGKPRHIRDIAHIYLSRLQSCRPAEHDRLVVCGDSRKTFPAFHTAALAAAFALKGSGPNSSLDVIVYDVSGVLPNVGYYFALPARTYFARNRVDPSGRVQALVGVSLGFSWEWDELRSSKASSPRLEIHHIPPYENRRGFRNALAELRRMPAGNTVFLSITLDCDNQCEIREAVASCLGDTPVLTLGVGTGHREYVADQIGTVTAWESSVADRIPMVCRDPRATLARRYQSICEGVIYKIRENRRRYSGAHSGRQPVRHAVRSNNR